jgi:hypothetical protein
MGELATISRRLLPRLYRLLERLESEPSFIGLNSLALLARFGIEKFFDAEAGVPTGPVLLHTRTKAPRSGQHYCFPRQS